MHTEQKLRRHLAHVVGFSRNLNLFVQPAHRSAMAARRERSDGAATVPTHTARQEVLNKQKLLRRVWRARAKSVGRSRR